MCYSWTTWTQPSAANVYESNDVGWNMVRVYIDYTVLTMFNILTDKTELTPPHYRQKYTLTPYRTTKDKEAEHPLPQPYQTRFA